LPLGDPVSLTPFEVFYAAYPRKRHKPAAQKAWKRIEGDRYLDAILAGVKAWRGSTQWEADKIEDPATFLTQRQWEDQPPTRPVAGVSSRTAGNLASIKKGLGL
jgi:hypothetical protein